MIDATANNGIPNAKNDGVNDSKINATLFT